MITRFISNNIYDTLNIEYAFDENMDIDNIQFNVDGNLNFNHIPCLKNTKDIKTNNSTLTILSKNDNLYNFLDFKDDSFYENNIFYIYQNSSSEINENALFLGVDDDFVVSNIEYDNLNIRNIFQIEFIDSEKCKIYHEKNNIKYVLAYSLSLSSVKMVSTEIPDIDSFNTELNYILNEKNIIFYVQKQIGNFAIKPFNNKLIITQCLNFSENNSFYLKSKTKSESLKNTNTWVSYKDTFNKNNLEISQDRSYFDITNNYLFTSTINSMVSSIPVNIMTLKNQLNQENDQSRGNVNLDENETTLKKYESIFVGGDREFGYDKINLGYTVYSTPFAFKSGKTTYFHVPHDIYPYKKLNVNSSKLAECGAIGGNSPLNSDKIWKKLKNYRDTSPYSIPKEENTGQWLCTWLSGGNPNTRPIWMDRYYNPSKTTPYLALSAIETEIIYNDSFDCLNLKSDVSDIKSSLTFESGCYYAYMHLGKNDYEHLITESLSSKIYHTSLGSYKKTNFLTIEPIEGEYYFDGSSYGYIDSNTKTEYNNTTFSFFLDKDNWDIPSGNLILGNYVNNGFGFYNYVLNTPYFLLKNDKDSLSLINNKFKLIDTLSTKNLTLCSISGISRREGFENIHIVTDNFKLLEIDLRGTIVDSNSALENVLSLKPSDIIYSITNDDLFCYVATSSGIAAIDLNNNNVSIKTEKTSIDSGNTFELLVDSNQNIYKVYGKQPIIRDTNIYYLSSNQIKSYSTSLSSISNVITTDDSIDCFSINKDNEINFVIRDVFYAYKNNLLIQKINLDSINNYSLSAIQLNYSEKFEYGKLRKFKNIFCNNETDSYVIQIDESYNQTEIKLDSKYNIIQNNLDISNYNYNIQYLIPKYSENSYIFKIKLLNKVNIEDFTDIVFLIDSNDLSTGYRHFAFSIDCYNGIASFYLDGQLYQKIEFEEKKYILSNTFNGKIYYGANGYFNGVPAFKYMKDPSDFVCSDFKLKENFIINKALDRNEIMYFYSKVYPPSDIIYNMPSGKRNFIDSMDKFFNFNIPMFKSNYFELNILNSSIIDDVLKKEMELHISNKIKEYLPIYSKIKKFNWINTTPQLTIYEGNYNVSNTLTDII